MLLKRIITALIGIPVAVYIINYGSWLFTAVISFIAVIAWLEFARMLRQKDVCISKFWGIIAILLFMATAWLGNTLEISFTIWLFLLLLAGILVLYPDRVRIPDIIFTFFGIVYIGASFTYFVLLRFTQESFTLSTAAGALDMGAAYLWVAFVGTWSSDTFAYFCGTCWGKHKLCPVISPGKTYEGFFGGLAGCILVVTALGCFFSFPLVHTFAIGAVVGLVAPLGDLLESALKRYCGVKDSGTLLPGHGGVLDRFDSLLFAVPVVYFYVYFFIL
ncbi:phosphatidate cytidylyltransferase [Acetonema longum]|uniref:Phosphatidate cytidylyltransferase n=1 Tax=Acetonema longum DSM 6540 TaxID=1009370 RepID=F7NL82_9FIRM|nr:phosphatidate cytidylyltransferase [Acetonema longum]EGO63187.1 phosphatidate cytidylyltransferase [Acetonema longum DSM 6540]